MLANVTGGGETAEGECGDTHPVHTNVQTRSKNLYVHTNSLSLARSLTHTHTHTGMHPHTLSSGVVSLRVADHTEIIISSRANSRHVLRNRHTPFCTVTRESLRYLLRLLLVWSLCFNPPSLAVISNRSQAPPSPWQHRPRNHGPSLRIQGLVVCVARTPHITKLQTDLRGQVYD